MAIQGIDSVTMLMADHGYSVHSQTYIATEDSLANRRDELVALLAGEVRGWEAYRQDTDAAARADRRDGSPTRGSTSRPSGCRPSGRCR